jgi:DNA-nicking Smr family endonuclease
MRRKPPSLDKPYKKHRRLHDDEVLIWRTEMGEEVDLPSSFREKEEEKVPQVRDRKPGHPIPDLPPKRGGKTAGVPSLLDHPTQKKIRREKMTIEATLDLHGHTQVTAHMALIGFIEAARAQGIRLALVITGKGKAGGGSLRTLLPRWLEEPSLREAVSGYSPANARHGGEGAWYVRIRKR